MSAIAKHLKRENKYIVVGYFIKTNKGERVTVKGATQEVWGGNCCKLMSEENPSEISEVCCVEEPVLDVSEEEVEKSLRGMKANKAL